MISERTITLHNGKTIPSTLYAVKEGDPLVNPVIISMNITEVSFIDGEHGESGFTEIKTTLTPEAKLINGANFMHTHRWATLYATNEHDIGGLVFTSEEAAKNYIVNSLEGKVKKLEHELQVLKKHLQEYKNTAKDSVTLYTGEQIPSTLFGLIEGNLVQALEIVPLQIIDVEHFNDDDTHEPCGTVLKTAIAPGAESPNAIAVHKYNWEIIHPDNASHFDRMTQAYGYSDLLFTSKEKAEAYINRFDKIIVSRY